VVLLGAALGLPAPASAQQESREAGAEGVPAEAGEGRAEAQAGGGADIERKGDSVTDAVQDESADEEGQTGAGTETLREAGEPVGGEPSFGAVAIARRPISRDSTTDATRVGGQRLRDTPRNSTLEAVSQQAADVYVSGRGLMHGVAGGSSGAIHVRGLGGSPNSQVLVVEDGVPDYQGIFGHPIPDAYVPFLIDEVLVIKGGDSVLYGTNAMGGAIVIRNRWRRAEGYEVLNDAALGSHATLRESASLLGRFGPWDTALAVHALSTEGHRQGAGGDELIAHTAVRHRFTPGLGLTLRNKAVKLDGADPGPVTHPHPDNTFDVFRDNASLQLAYRRDRLRLTVTPYLNVGDHRLYDGFHSTDLVSGASSALHLELHRTAELLLGIDGERMSGDIENRITDERIEPPVMADVSFFNQLTLRPVAPLTLVLGSRELYSNTYDFVFLYKAGARLNLVGDLYLRTRVARNFRQPTIRELYLPYPIANPDLRPEYALNLDLGLGGSSERFEVACTGYRTAADDMIKYFGAWPSAEVVNIDRIVIWGVEGQVALRVIDPVSLQVTGDLQDVGRYTRQNPDAKVDFTLDVGQALGRHFIGGSLSGEWVHGLYMADYARQPIADAFVLDLALRYRYTEPATDVTLEPYLFLRNLLDRRYAYVAGYPMPGFNVLVGLKVGV
jgi:outer membrane receptor protein involved in Fe transport